MLRSENHQSGKVVGGLARIPLKQVGFLCGFGALVGGPIALFSAFFFMTHESIPTEMKISGSGMFLEGFLALCSLTVPYIIYLAKEVTTLKEHVHSMNEADAVFRPSSAATDSNGEQGAGRQPATRLGSVMEP